MNKMIGLYSTLAHIKYQQPQIKSEKTMKKDVINYKIWNKKKSK